ncbi:MAG: hypothetical protein HKO57_15010, partial [Akkermansiaceae bacterium]|nr:hypothetical protein [Akkermansiaceae bacterium]
MAPPPTLSDSPQPGPGPSRSRSLRGRLLRSHMAVAAIGLAMLGLILLFTFYIRDRTAELAHVDAPMAQASRKALEGMERSLADLRGWVVIKDERFVHDRRHAWAEQIEPAMEQLKLLHRPLGPDERQSIADIERLLSELKEIQWWIEDVAQTPGNEPARDLLMNGLQPTMTKIYEAITALINLEKAADQNGRSNRILAAMADFRGFFTRSWATMGNLVESGAESDEQAFRSQLGVAQRRLEDLAADAASLGPEQRALLNFIVAQFPRYVAV